MLLMEVTEYAVVGTVDAMVGLADKALVNPHTYDGLEFVY